VKPEPKGNQSQQRELTSEGRKRVRWEGGREVRDALSIQRVKLIEQSAGEFLTSLGEVLAEVV